MARQEIENRDYVIINGQKVRYNRPKPTRLWLQEQADIEPAPLSDRQRRMTRGWKR